MGDQDYSTENLHSYLRGSVSVVRDSIERFEFHTQIDRPDKASWLYPVTKKLASIYWHPDLKSLQNQAASCWG